MIAVAILAVSLCVPAAEPEPEITVMLGGDVLVVGNIARAYEKGGADAVIDPLLMGLFRGADIAMVNLEMPVSTRGSAVPDKEYTFRGDPKHLRLIEDMGVDVVSVANNHTLDYGRDAFLDTLKYLTETGIGYSGGGKNLKEASAPWVTEVQGRTVGVVSASRIVPSGWSARDGTSGVLSAYNHSQVLSAISGAKEACDFVLIYVHWGVEHEQIATDLQRRQARDYIDAGADAVIGAHPHILQGFEIYNGKPIAYSLGNFIFSTSNPNPNTCAVRLHLTDAEVWLEVIPCRISQPRTSMVTDAEETDARLRALEKISFGGVTFDEVGRLCAAE